MSTAPRRRWFRFSLRTCFVVVTLVAIGCGLVAWQAGIVREQKDTFELIRVRAIELLEDAPRVHGFDPKWTWYVEWEDEPRFWRRWFGAHGRLKLVRYPPGKATQEDIDRVKAAFPEATIDAWGDENVEWNDVHGYRIVD